MGSDSRSFTKYEIHSKTGSHIQCINVEKCKMIFFLKVKQIRNNQNLFHASIMKLTLKKIR
jgi:hypothetical protein